MKNNFIAILVVASLVGSASFYGGMLYQQKKTPARNDQFPDRSRGLNTADRPGGMQRDDQRTAPGMRPIGGEIINQDDTSLTLKMTDGSTKIIIVASTTTMSKSMTGSKTDLKTGEKITVFGTQNQDGSVTAQNIAIGETMPSGMARHEPQN